MKCFAAVIFVLAIMLISPAQSAVDLGELYRVAVNGAATSQGCGQRQMKNVQEHLEHQRSAAQLCTRNRFGQKAIDCFNMIANLLKLFFKKLTAKCKDVSFIATRTKYGSLIDSAPNDQLVESLKLLPTNVPAPISIVPAPIQPPVPAEPTAVSFSSPAPSSFAFDLVHIYNGIRDSLKYGGCFAAQMKISKSFLEDIWHEARYHLTQHDLADHASMILRKIELHFVSSDAELKQLRCIDPIYQNAKEAFKAPIIQHLKGLRIFAETEIFRPKLKIDFTRILRSLTKNVKDAGCLKQHMDNATTEMSKYQTMAAECPPNDVTCFKAIGSKISSLFSEIEKEIGIQRCFDFVFDEIRRAVGKGLKACSDDDLINSVRYFGNTPIA